MASAADETKQQIDGLRDEVTAILNELEGRGKRLFGVADVARSMPNRMRGRAKRGAEQNPIALALVGLGVVMGIAALVARGRRRAAEERQPAAVLRRTAQAAAEDVGEYMERARGSIPFGIRFGSRGAPVAVEKRDDSMVKKLLWMGLSAGSLALAGLLARRISAALWERALGEPPPTAKA